MNLKELRIANKETQAEIANLLGITRAAYTNIENGKREPDIATLDLLANHFSVSVDYLLGRDTQKNNAPLLSQKDVVIDATPVQGSIDVETLLEYFALLTFSERQEFLKAALDVVVDSRSEGEQGKK